MVDDERRYPRAADDLADESPVCLRGALHVATAMEEEDGLAGLSQLRTNPPPP